MMANEIKSGKEILDDFFKEVQQNKELDKDTTQRILELYELDSLSDKNLTNALEELRESKDKGDGEDK